MSTKMRNRALLSLILSLSTAELTFGQSTVGSRAAGMAGAYVAVADDATAVYWNPAGIATTSIVSGTLSFGEGEVAPSQPQTTAGQRDNATIAALSATAFGVAYYRLATYGTSAAESAVSGPDGREEVVRSVHAVE